MLEQRPATGIWGGLWSFREFDSLEALEGYCQQALGVAKPELQAWPQVKHSFSHFDLSITPVEVTVDTPLRAVMEPAGALWYPLQAKPGTSGKAVGLAAPVKTLLAQLALRPSHLTR